MCSINYYTIYMPNIACVFAFGLVYVLAHCHDSWLWHWPYVVAHKIIWPTARQRSFVGVDFDYIIQITCLHQHIAEASTLFLFFFFCFWQHYSCIRKQKRWLSRSTAIGDHSTVTSPSPKISKEGYQYQKCYHILDSCQPATILRLKYNSRTWRKPQMTLNYHPHTYLNFNHYKLLPSLL